jgi:hypothetical protein
MNRLAVLFLCLASAGAIAGYTHYSGDRGDAPPVFTVAQRGPEPAPKPATAVPPAATIDPGDRVALARALQRELKRVGCYHGEITGVWTTSSRMAMKAFTDRVNATLPIDTPDQVLLSLVQGHRDRACGVACPAGQTADESGACVPNAVLAKGQASPPADGPAAEAPADKTGAALPVAGAAAAAMALTGPKSEAKTPSADAARPAAVNAKPQDVPGPEKRTAVERTPSHGGPVPPEGIREKKTRRSAQNSKPRPPKVVRDVLRALGF